MRKYVIIGNGNAAVNCIEGIRSIDKNGSITIVSEENHPAYCRPLISYYLEGKAVLGRMGSRSEDFYERMNCKVLYGAKALHISPEKHEVELEDGAKLSYDSLCLATGSSPFVPPFEGLESVEKKYTFMTLDDALSLESAISPDSRIFIIGAGLIGLKCAEGLYGRVAGITVCDLADRVLSSILDAECAAVMQRHLQEHGLRFLLKDSVMRFDKDRAYMKSGEEIVFDILVLAVGVRANTNLLKEIGGEVNRGILVNERMETSIPEIFAAGDCSEGYDISFGDMRVLAILPNSSLQGHAAGVNMAGGNETFSNAVPMNSIGFFGLHAMTAGSYDGRLFDESDGDNIRRFYTKDGKLAGFMLIGQTQRAGLYTSLIREQTPLDSLDFKMLRKTATSAAFSPETRRKMFGDEV